MREGEFFLNQHHPTFMGMIIKYLLDGCNGFLQDFAGE